MRKGAEEELSEIGRSGGAVRAWQAPSEEVRECEPLHRLAIAAVDHLHAGASS
jgi:hypothetical protein